MDILKTGREVFDIEMEGLEKMRQALGENFVTIAEKIHECKGRVVCTGMGKSGHIFKKVAATMASIGIKAYFMHPAEALHGDLGLLTKDDIVLALSNGGETEEILKLIPSIQKIGAPLYGIVGRENSTLEKYSAAAIVFPNVKEAFLGNLVPTTTTTISLVIGDALAVTVAKMRGFTPNEFAIFHPNGLLGKKLTMKVSDLMKKGEENAVVKEGMTVQEAVFEMCKRPIGCVNVVDEGGRFTGVFTDGDLRRLISKEGEKALNHKIEEVMTKNPIAIGPDLLVVDAVENMKKFEKTVSTLAVVKEKELLGTLCVADIAKAGLI